MKPAIIAVNLKISIIKPLLIPIKTKRPMITREIISKVCINRFSVCFQGGRTIQYSVSVEKYQHIPDFVPNVGPCEQFSDASKAHHLHPEVVVI